MSDLFRSRPSPSPSPRSNTTPAATLTWRKTGAATYVAYLSRNFSDWGEDLDDSITAEEDERTENPDHITVTFPLDGVQPDTPELFFRIEEG